MMIFFHFFKYRLQLEKWNSEFYFYQGIWAERLVRYDFMKTFIWSQSASNRLKIIAE